MQRVGRPLAFVALAVAAAGCYVAVGSGGSGHENRTAYGLHQDLTYDGSKWRRDLAIRHARELRAEISRNSMLWHRIEATPGQRDWSLTDAVIEELTAANIDPLFVVVGSPPWANGAPAGVPNPQFYVPPTGADFDRWLASYREFVRAAVRRYRGRVNRWELWNEQNQSDFWTPRPNVDQYARLYRELRTTILEEDPGAEVAVGGLAGIAAGGEITGMSFLRTLMARGVEVDHVALHPYPSGDHAPEVHNRHEDNFDDIGLIHGYLRKVDSSAQIWVTEWGWSSADVGEEAQARYLETSLKLLRDRYPYVELATYFVDYDRPPTYYQGLFDSNFNPKPSATVFSGFLMSLDSDEN